MKVNIKTIGQKGETIVEVLLSISVLAMALGGAYVISNRSKNTLQANAERYQAQLIANGQADALKIYMAEHSDFNNGRCLVNGDKKTLAEADACMFDNGTNPNLYDVTITEPSAGIFVITVTWDSLINKTQDKVELVYGT